MTKMKQTKKVMKMKNNKRRRWWLIRWRKGYTKKQRRWRRRRQRQWSRKRNWWWWRWWWWNLKSKYLQKRLTFFRSFLIAMPSLPESLRTVFIVFCQLNFPEKWYLDEQYINSYKNVYSLSENNVKRRTKPSWVSGYVYKTYARWNRLDLKWIGNNESGLGIEKKPCTGIG